MTDAEKEEARRLERIASSKLLGPDALSTNEDVKVNEAARKHSYTGVDGSTLTCKCGHTVSFPSLDAAMFEALDQMLEHLRSGNTGR